MVVATEEQISGTRRVTGIIRRYLLLYATGTQLHCSLRAYKTRMLNVAAALCLQDSGPICETLELAKQT